MMSEDTNWNDAELHSEAVEQMARYGITCVQISQFRFGHYRYANLEDAIAEAKRHSQARTDVERQASSL
jgi:hypothetical protein